MEKLHISKSVGKTPKYELLIPQIVSLIGDEKDLIANLGNIAAALKYGMDFFWTGFYFTKGSELVLGPFQGTIACTRIPFGKGVCGACWKEKRTIVVENVENFPGHIACSSESISEIVLPVFDAQKNVVMVLDIDSDQLAAFDETDKKYLGEIVLLIENLIER